MIENLDEEHPKVVESDQEELVGAEEEIANIEDQEQQETLMVSLATMLGITQYPTLGVRSKVKGRTTVALVDSSSTHNFINSNWLPPCPTLLLSWPAAHWIQRKSIFHQIFATATLQQPFSFHHPSLNVLGMWILHAEHCLGRSPPLNASFKWQLSTMACLLQQ
eukprot:Gb_05367 [translate_table: standard]